VRLYYVAEW